VVACLVSPGVEIRGVASLFNLSQNYYPIIKARQKSHSIFARRRPLEGLQSAYPVENRE
jgi:hypothetical protein